MSARRVADYIDALSEERRGPMEELIDTIRGHLPEGFEERMSGGMPSWVVPHALYPPGYHVNPELPLPFISVASQKGHVGLYHMGLYASVTLMEWFVSAYPEHCKTKLNMGKSCVRFVNPKKIPYALIGALCERLTPGAWVSLYEAEVKRG